LRGRRENIAKTLTAKKLERRNFNRGSFSYQLAKEPASIFLLGFVWRFPRIGGRESHP
jgi:hypothetical protein